MKSARSFLGGWLLIVYTNLIQAAPVVVSENSKEEIQEKSLSTIFQFNNPLHQVVLNEPTHLVKKLPDPEVDLLIQKMLSGMREKKGAGISANQIGFPLQVVVMDKLLAADAEASYSVYINPVITSASQSTSCFWHGCLSSEGGKYGKVATWQKITVTGLDQTGEKIIRELDNIEAIVFQHEFRHLLGGGYHDHASDFKEERELRSLMLDGKLKPIESCEAGEEPLLADYVIGETIEAYSKRKNKKQLTKKEALNKPTAEKQKKQEPPKPK